LTFDSDAIALDQRLRACIDLARQSDVSEHRRQAMSCVVIDGGPTGVELAATLADLLPHWYQKRGGDPLEVRVVLLNRGPQILKGDINDPRREAAERKLQETAVLVEVITAAKATAVRPDAVDYKRKGREEVITLPASSSLDGGDGYSFAG